MCRVCPYSGACSGSIVSFLSIVPSGAQRTLRSNGLGIIIVRHFVYCLTLPPLKPMLIEPHLASSKMSFL